MKATRSAANSSRTGSADSTARRWTPMRPGRAATRARSETRGSPLMGHSMGSGYRFPAPVADRTTDLDDDHRTGMLAAAAFTGINALLNIIVAASIEPADAVVANARTARLGFVLVWGVILTVGLAQAAPRPRHR